MTARKFLNADEDLVIVIKGGPAVDNMVYRDFFKTQAPLRKLDELCLTAKGVAGWIGDMSIMAFHRYDTTLEKVVEDVTEEIARAWLDLETESETLIERDITDCPLFIQGFPAVFDQFHIAATDALPESSAIHDDPDDGDDKYQQWKDDQNDKERDE